LGGITTFGKRKQLEPVIPANAGIHGPKVVVHRLVAGVGSDTPAVSNAHVSIVFFFNDL
jgi:hypothetical protein